MYKYMYMYYVQLEPFVSAKNEWAIHASSCNSTAELLVASYMYGVIHDMHGTYKYVHKSCIMIIDNCVLHVHVK